MAQAFALLTPPIHIAISAFRRRFVLSNLLRSMTINTFLVGPIIGAGMTYAKMSSTDDAGMVDRAERIRANVLQTRVDDYSVIGGVLGAVVTPTLFLRRAPIPLLVAGGAGFGIAGGVITHLAKNFKDGTGGVQQMVEEAKSL
ncbi:hypothetical protein T439DRAFT_321103 [Meredithblackwellia eburnea MCA 4105]